MSIRHFLLFAPLASAWAPGSFPNQGAGLRPSTTSVRTWSSSSDSVERFSLSDLVFDRYIGEVTYSVVATYGKDVASSSGDLRSGVVGRTPQLESQGRSSTRLFQASRTDPGIRSRGGDPRCLVKEVAASTAGRRGLGDAAALASRELAASKALEAEWEVRQTREQAGGGGLFGLALAAFGGGGGGGSSRPKPFSVLLGELDFEAAAAAPSGAGEAAVFREWSEALGTAAPRPNATWLVYEWDGLNTLATFAVPTKARVASVRALRQRLEAQGRGGLFLPPVPESAPFDKVAQFLVKGVVSQSLEAVSLLHEAGLAHRGLGNMGSLGLTALDSQDKSTPFEGCEVGLLLVKLQALGFSTPLTDSSADRQASALLWLGTDKPTPLQLASLSLAEDLHGLGLALLATMLNALAEVPDGPDGEYPADGLSSATGGLLGGSPGGSPGGGLLGGLPGLGVRDLERLLDGPYKGDAAPQYDPATGQSLRLGKLEEFLASDPRTERACRQVLGGRARAGWDFFASLLYAREEAAKGGKDQPPRPTRGLLDHPFLD